MSFRKTDSSAIHILNTPNFVSSTGAFSAPEYASAATGPARSAGNCGLLALVRGLVAVRGRNACRAREAQGALGL
jgi:hypothetical protein